jgi:hypothetical protein
MREGSTTLRACSGVPGRPEKLNLPLELVRPSSRNSGSPVSVQERLYLAPWMVANPEPWLVLRAEYDEWRLLEQHADLYDAVLVKDAYTAPYPEDHPHHGCDGERLIKAVPDGRELWRDPDTAGLVSRSSVHLGRSARRRCTPLAREFDLPLDLAMLAREPALRDLAVDLALENQSDSATRIPPYFDIDRRDSVALYLNLQMLRRTVAAVGDEVPTAVIQVTRHRLMRGLLAAVARDYAPMGVMRVLLRVRGLEAQQAERDELIAYLDAVKAFERGGVEVLPDCVGWLGPVFVAECARGYTTGTRFFRKVPAALLSVDGGGGGVPIGVQDPGTWEERSREPGVDAFDARIASLRSLRALTLLAARDPDALIVSLRQGGRYPAIWAGVLAERRRRIA